MNIYLFVVVLPIKSYFNFTKILKSRALSQLQLQLKYLLLFWISLCIYFRFVYDLFVLGVPGNSWRSGDDLSKLYDTMTPNPTGSLSGPYFDQDSQLHRVGVRGKPTHLACRVKNLQNYTVRFNALIVNSKHIWKDLFLLYLFFCYIFFFVIVFFFR